MFCNQCEETSKGTGCSTVGVCGKKPEVAALQDLLTMAVRGLAVAARAARGKGVQYPEVNRFVCEALFTTLTNVNFDGEAIAEYIRETVRKTRAIRSQLGQDLVSDDPALNFEPAPDLEGLIKQGEAVGPLGLPQHQSPDIRSLQEILVYGVRGVAAYTHHAALLGKEDDSVYAFIEEALGSLTNNTMALEDWLGLVLKCGEINLRAMELLDAAHTETFGHPEPTAVSLGHRAGKCILVSGHDLKDLKDLLEQTSGKGINIYTHGEMLPAHGYPELKKYPHLVGHYGTAWQNQSKEFAEFPGPILMTTNCIREPKPAYADRIFTTGPVGWPGVKHVRNGDFKAVIDKALEAQGFADEVAGPTVMVGFARNAVLGVADKIIDAVKNGAIKHFFLVGGCDGARPGRSYYADFVEKTPSDTVVLTLACGKFRFFDKQLGDIGGIPRLLDIGQCNDAYSAVQIALALADAFKCGVNDLPLSMVLSWYEQKAVSILLTLLYLGIKDIRLGPTLPAFISPGVLQVLADNYGIKPITTVEQDMAALLGS